VLPKLSRYWRIGTPGRARSSWPMTMSVRRESWMFRVTSIGVGCGSRKAIS
jgi:hypothetical protein